VAERQRNRLGRILDSGIVNETSATTSSLIYSFGSFELSASANTLTRAGELIRTQYLPFQMLLFLLERAGQMVTKEELRERLWGGDTFVEVDQNLYVIVSKLRELLSDQARQPRFIQTVSGRGYRFIGSVTQRSDVFVPAAPEVPVSSPQSALEETNQFLPLSTASQEQETDHSDRARFSSPTLAIVVTLAVLLTASVTGFLLYRNRYQPRYIPHERILMGAFAGDTKKPDLSQILPFAVQLRFQQSPSFDVVPAQAIRQRVGEINTAGRDEQLHICASLGGKVLLNGQLSSAARGYRVSLTASQCDDGRLLATEAAQADSDASIMSAVDAVTDQMRRHLGEPESTLQRFSVPLTQATTKSLAALEAFTQGEDKLRLGNNLDAISDYKMAIDLDPQFALAYARLGTIYINAQQLDLGSEYYKKAFQLRDRTTDRERLYIAVHYYTDVTGEYQRAIETYKLWGSLYPNDWGVPNNLANLYDMLGHPSEGLVYARQLEQMNPGSVVAHATIAQAYLENGDYSSLTRICGSPEVSKTQLVALHNICFMSAFAQGNDEDMAKELTWSHGSPQQSMLLDSAAQAALFRGHVKESRSLFSQARESARLNHLPEMVSLVDNDEAIAEGALGLSGPVREATNQAIRDAHLGDRRTEDPETLGDRALALAIVGATGPASRYEAEAVRSAPVNSIVNDLDVPTVQAVLAMKQNNPNAAIASLKIATPIQYCASTRFAPAYYRGFAYMQAKQWKNAEDQFEEILKHKAILPFSVYLVLAQVQLGRALQMQGQLGTARAAYDAAAAEWEDADPNFAPAKQIAEYQTHLQR
jgi:DNA-binding winged helix-turn-helix (wHTH) protein/tetratricopeptide (TPR) repeat protein